MRNIKFRAWEESSQSMVEDAMPHKARYYKQPLMQYTGLRDKNGKEIYEGDIIEGQKDFYPRSIIGFEDGSFVIQQTPLAKWKVSHFELEVIGNIYENPELIN